MLRMVEQLVLLSFVVLLSVHINHSLANYSELQLGVEDVDGDEVKRDDFPLPPDFVFGASSSAYQVEGAADQDGRTPSIWDTYAHAGKMHGATGDIACDQYHKYKEDVQLMVDTGLEAYRFSISWSRLIPNVRGPANPKGVEYYNNLIDQLISKGIQPHVTLHHSDMPQALDDEYGGWISSQIVEDFTAYANVCFKQFGDRVKHWTTMNEPNAFALGGYDLGFLPPSRCSAPFGLNYCSRGNSTREPYLAIHNLLLSHASAAALYKQTYQRKQLGFIGINLLTFWFLPQTKTAEDQAAAQRAMDFYVGCSFDFLGINYYYTQYVTDNSAALRIQTRDYVADSAVQLSSMDHNTTTFEFPITPWDMESLLEYVKQNYGNPPLYIHENGQQTRRNSLLEDWSRIDCLRGHIQSLLNVMRNGSNGRGYFMWSLLDSIELLGGIETSFGLYYIDLDDPDLRRQPKLSAHWYSKFLKNKNYTLLSDSVADHLNSFE